MVKNFQKTFLLARKCLDRCKTWPKSFLAQFFSRGIWILADTWSKSLFGLTFFRPKENLSWMFLTTWRRKTSGSRQNECDIVPMNDVLRFYIKVGSRITNETFDVSFWFYCAFHNHHVPLNLRIDASESRIISSLIITRHISGFPLFSIFFFWQCSTLTYRKKS